MKQYNFNAKVALVTGGIKGIGRAIAIALLKNNAKVVVCFNQDTFAAKDMEQSLKEQGLFDFLILQKDISSRGQVRELLRAIEDKWHQQVAYLINNAGILKQGNFFELSDEQWDRTLAVNLKSAFILAQECLPKMQFGDAIVNISSVGGQTGGDLASDYAASKAALISLTRSLARIASKQGVRSNAVAPGWIETPIFNDKRIEELKLEAKTKIPLGRMGRPEEVADAVLFLLSDDASFITGHTLNVNGGMYFG
ncbi:SDR family oxidoreductase [Candidatus Falkowbacteria bacterium]|nr:SDR family oxidoreductase [Candidatus Falkowbacteria bacterium]